jgi:DNA polymerase family A
VQRAASGPAAGRWVVPTYHPSFIQRGATNLTDVMRFDLIRAKQVADQIIRTGRFDYPPITLHLDPSPLAFRFLASQYLAELARDPDRVWLAVDIETPDKAGGRDEGELTTTDTSTKIERVNFAFRPDEGWTVPYEGPYIGLIDELLAAAGTLLMWYKTYDEPRLALAGHTRIGREVWDCMWAAHHLQSDLPLGLGFWAPLYSPCKAWKFLGKQKGKEAEYGGWDGVHTLRCGHGIVKDLVDAGLWDAFYRHTHVREQYCLRPAHDIGLAVDVDRLDTFHVDLQTALAGRLKAIGDSEASGTLKPKQGYIEKPDGPPPAGLFGKAREKGDQAKADYLAERIQLVERSVVVEVKVCRTCGKRQNIGPRHKCPKHLVEPSLFTDGLPPTPEIAIERRREHRWFWQLPFNPDAPGQILRFIEDSGEEPGRAKKSRKATTNKETLQKLWKKTHDAVYKDILDYKAIKKVDSTYVMGAKQRIWADRRLHPWITHRPSTLRDSCVNPNLQNVIADKAGPESLAAGFRHCIVAAPGCKLVELDFSGIEAVETGWMMDDPDYIRLAYLGMHAYLASHLLERPASLSWSNDDLSLYFKEIKKKEQVIYDKAKRCVHGNAYGLTAFGMWQQFPDVYQSQSDAQKVQDLYYAVAPKLRTFHQRVQDHAHVNGFLGGAPIDDFHGLTQTCKHHPYGYRHWFWGVISLRPLTQAEYRRSVLWATKRKLIDPETGRPKGITLLGGRPYKIVLGEDAKRTIAFYPQSIAAGRLKEAEIDLLHPESDDFVGDFYYGRTPFRVPIHDSLLFECPDALVDRLIETAVGVMRRPEYRQPCPPEWGIGDYLQVDVAVKVGREWGAMDDVAIPPMSKTPTTGVRESLYLPEESEQWADLDDLATDLVRSPTTLH